MASFSTQIFAGAHVNSDGTISTGINGQPLNYGFLDIQKTGEGEYELELELQYGLLPEIAVISILPLTTDPSQTILLTAPIITPDGGGYYRFLKIKFYDLTGSPTDSAFKISVGRDLEHLE